MASKKLWCRSVGCRNFQTKNGYCDQHQYKVVDYRTQHTATRPEAYDHEWNKVRLAYIAEHPLCEDCNARGKTTPAREVHHIIPLADGGDRTDWNNLVALCSYCHHQRHRDLLATQKLTNQINYIKEKNK